MMGLLDTLKAGQLFQATVGADASPATFLTTFAVKRPALVIDLASTDAAFILPVSLDFDVQTATGTMNGVILFANTALCGNAGGSSTAVTPKSLLAGPGRGSVCSAYSLYTGDCTEPTGRIQIARWMYPFADAATRANLAHWDYTMSPTAMIKPPGSIIVYVYATTNAPTGFLRLTWAEFTRKV